MKTYNCHTHVFNARCAPNRFIGVPIARLMCNNKISFWLVRKLRNAIKGNKNDFFEKYANFLAIGRMKTQEFVFEDLKSNYLEDTRFIVLTIDMDYMGAGKAVLNFRSQIHEVINVKKKFPNTFFPFIGIDPRRGDERNLLDFLKLHIENLGFYGIKLYPGLGFYPFDPRLLLIYKYAHDNQLPIIVHCTKNGIYYRGKEYSLDQLKPKNLNGEYMYGNNFTNNKNIKNAMFKDKFTNPANYEYILKKFPNLKICFAHFGGNDEIKRYLKKASDDNWYIKVKKLMEDYENVYTDISYTLSDKKVFNTLKEDINNDALKNKILFGTDYFMTIRKKSERSLVTDFKPTISQENFKLISQQNPKKFLSSSFFKP